jgi:hypothetical protein
MPRTTCCSRSVLTGLGLGLAWVPLTLCTYPYKQGMIVIGSVVTAYFVFRTLPYLSKVIHQKPTYFEDLMVYGAPTSGLQHERRLLFSQIMACCLAVAVGSVVEYGFIKLQHVHMNYLEVLGVVGGLCSLYRSIQNCVGKLVIFVLKRREARRPTRRQKHGSNSNRSSCRSNDARCSIQVTEV